MNDDLEDLTAQVRRRVTEVGYELVDLRRRGSQTRPLLQVRVDRPDSEPGRGITHQNCADVSRALERWLDEVQPLGTRYVLEVSSPGIERPVRWPEHWRRFRGRDVNVKLVGRGRVRAMIVDVIDDGGTLLLRLEGTETDVAVPLHEAREATLAVDWN